MTSEEVDSARRQAIKDAYIAARGYWVELTEQLLDLAPEFLDGYRRYSEVPSASGLVARYLHELIYVALDSSTTHMFGEGARIHMENALASGATMDQVLEVIQLTTSRQALDTASLGARVLVEELAAAGRSADIPPLDGDRESIKEQFVRAIGHWPNGADDVLRMSPELVLGLQAVEAPSWTAGGLTPAERALVLVALAVSPASPNVDSARANVRLALSEGCDPRTIFAVVQISSHLAFHACMTAVPAVVDLSATAP